MKSLKMLSNAARHQNEKMPTVPLNTLNEQPDMVHNKCNIACNFLLSRLFFKL